MRKLMLSVLLVFFPVFLHANFLCDLVVKDDFKQFERQLNHIDSEIQTDAASDKKIKRELIDASNELKMKLYNLGKRCALKQP